MATPHAIHEEFPNDGDRIHELKLRDARFARLLEEYDEINDEVHAAETSVRPVSEEAEKEMRRKRAHLKDEIARMLNAARAG